MKIRELFTNLKFSRDLPSKTFKGISRTRIWFHFSHSFSIFGLFVIHDIYILISVGFAFEKCRARKSSYHLQFKFFQLNLRASYAN